MICQNFIDFGQDTAFFVAPTGKSVGSILLLFEPTDLPVGA
jgi:hypothetical protein